MKIVLTITRWNLGVLAGWFAVIIGIIGLLLHLYMNIEYGIWFGVIGVISGGLAITFGGSIKTSTHKTVNLRPADINEHHET